MTPLLERFLDKTEPRPSNPDACWMWTGYRGPDGYGYIQVGRVSPGGHCAPTTAHRVSHELFIGPIPDALHIDHLCRNRGCVSPLHIEAVTPGENSRRGIIATRPHCAAGHTYTPESTYIFRGQRRCRICKRRHDAAYQAKRRAAYASERVET